MNTIIEILDAHIEVAEKMLLTIEYISMPPKIADKLAKEIFGQVDESIATGTIKTYRNIPIRELANNNIKVCYATTSFLDY